MEIYLMLQNARLTAFTDFELLSEINSGAKYTPTRLGLNLTYNNMQHTFKQKNVCFRFLKTCLLSEMISYWTSLIEMFHMKEKYGYHKRCYQEYINKQKLEIIIKKQNEESDFAVQIVQEIWVRKTWR